MLVNYLDYALYIENKSGMAEITSCEGSSLLGIGYLEFAPPLKYSSHISEQYLHSILEMPDCQSPGLRISADRQLARE